MAVRLNEDRGVLDGHEAQTLMETASDALMGDTVSQIEVYSR